MKLGFVQLVLLILLSGLKTNAGNLNELTFESSVSPETKQQVSNDLSFMGGVTGTSPTPLHERMIGAVEGNTYLNWFTSRIFSVASGDCGGPAYVACVYPSQNPHRMVLSAQFTNQDHPQVTRISILYHEARHSEAINGHWQHVKCPASDENGQTIIGNWTGLPLEGLLACDESIYGAYGIQIILLKNLQMNCTNCTEKAKEDAGIYAESLLKRLVNRDSKKILINDLKF